MGKHTFLGKATHTTAWPIPMSNYEPRNPKSRNYARQFVGELLF